jgi:hypothetical protein
MSQNVVQNRDRQNQGEGYRDSNRDQSTREGRTGSSSDREQQQNRGETPGRPDQTPDLEDTEEMDDEDRDDDQRTEGGANRRRSIS